MDNNKCPNPLTCRCSERAKMHPSHGQTITMSPVVRRWVENQQNGSPLVAEKVYQSR